jgi:hypothetical protein
VPRNVVARPGVRLVTFRPRGPRDGSRAAHAHGDAVPLAGRVDVGKQPRRRHRAGGRPAARGVADPGPHSGRPGRTAAAPAVAPVRPLRRGPRRPGGPAAPGGRGRPGADRRPRRPDGDLGDRRGERRSRPRRHVPARHGGGLRGHHRRHAAADGRGQGGPRHRQRPADGRHADHEPAGGARRGRDALRGRHGLAVRRAGRVPRPRGAAHRAHAGAADGAVGRADRSSVASWPRVSGGRGTTGPSGRSP